MAQDASRRGQPGGGAVQGDEPRRAQAQQQRGQGVSVGEQRAVPCLELAQVGCLVDGVQREVQLVSREHGAPGIQGRKEVAHLRAFRDGDRVVVMRDARAPLHVDAADGGVWEVVERRAPQEQQLLEVRSRLDERVSRRVAVGHGTQVHQRQPDQPGAWAAREAHQVPLRGLQGGGPDEHSQRAVEQARGMEAVLAERVEEAVLDEVSRAGRQLRSQPRHEQGLTLGPPGLVVRRGAEVERHQLAPRVSALLEVVGVDSERVQVPRRRERALQLAQRILTLAPRRHGASLARRGAAGAEAGALRVALDRRSGMRATRRSTAARTFEGRCLFCGQTAKISLP